MHIELNGLLIGLFDRLRSLLRLCLSKFELLLVNGKAELLSHKSGKVHREAVGVVQPPDVLAGELLLATLLGLLDVLVEKFLTTVECSREGLLFLVQDLLDLLDALCQLREDIALEKMSACVFDMDYGLLPSAPRPRV